MELWLLGQGFRGFTPQAEGNSPSLCCCSVLSKYSVEFVSLELCPNLLNAPSFLWV